VYNSVDVYRLQLLKKAAESGWQPLYFGSNLPAEEIAAAVKMTVAKATALSISHRIELTSIIRELRKLRSYCANRVQIYGGRK
jgi:MerR family transcriptional regulator, light-induced transcriptional regulator